MVFVFCFWTNSLICVILQSKTCISINSHSNMVFISMNRCTYIMESIYAGSGCNYYWLNGSTWVRSRNRKIQKKQWWNGLKSWNEQIMIVMIFKDMITFELSINKKNMYIQANYCAFLPKLEYILFDNDWWDAALKFGIRVKHLDDCYFWIRNSPPLVFTPLLL